MTETIPDMLDMHSTLPTQTGIKKSQDGDEEVIHSIESEGTISFLVTTGIDEYLDVKATKLFLRVKVLKEDGTDFVAASGNARRMIPVNGWGYALFKGLEIKLNGTLIAHNDGMYAYRGDLSTRLFNSDKVKKNLQNIGFIEEHTAFDDIADDAALNFDNAEDANHDHKALMSRYMEIVNSKTYELLCPVFGDIFDQKKPLPSKTKLQLSFTRNEAPFLMMTKTATRNCRIKIIEAVLKVKRLKIEDHVLRAIDKETLSGNPMKYPIHRVNMTSWTKPPGIQKLQLANVFDGILPRKFWVCMVNQAAFEGNKGKDPFNYQDFGIIEIEFKIGTETTPYPLIKVNFNEKRVLNALYYLQNSVGMAFAEESLGIDKENYKKRNVIFGYDLSPSEVGDAFERNIESAAHITINLEAGLTDAVQIIVFAVYDAELHIDAHRNIALYLNA